MRRESCCCPVALAAWLLAAVPTLHAQAPRPDPVKAPDSPVLLDLPGSGIEPAKIDYSRLPVLPTQHAVVSAPDAAWGFRLHNYLLHHDGKYWCMWSHGPAVEDLPTQHVRYATSADGLKWSEAKVLIPAPKEPYAYIARGFWVYNGELLALAAHYKDKGAFGVNKELKLEAYAYDKPSDSWKFKGVLFENAINNFAPEKRPTGDWMMTRRDARFNVSMLVGGVKGFDDWKVIPVFDRLEALRKFELSPDEPIWYAQPDRSFVALFRDNGGSSRLFRSFSTDNGQTWSRPTLTNYPNSSSKLFAHRTAAGSRLLLSNANPRLGRRELHLAVSADGLVFTRMARLDIPSPKPATLQYPHAIEHDGCLLIAFSRNKTTIEVVKVKLADIEALRK